jgi:hypothetical protein
LGSPAVPSGHHQHQIQQRAPAPHPFPLPLHLPRSFLLPLLCYLRVRLQFFRFFLAVVADFATNFERNLTDTPRISLDLQRSLTLQSGCLRTSANPVVRIMQPELYRIAEVEQLDGRPVEMGISSKACENKNRLSISLPLTCSEGRRSRRLQRRSPPELGGALLRTHKTFRLAVGRQWGL